MILYQPAEHLSRPAAEIKVVAGLAGGGLPQDPGSAVLDAQDVLRKLTGKALIIVGYGVVDLQVSPDIGVRVGRGS